jgi:eukaryotic-like serine/threonine-protein kinase
MVAFLSKNAKNGGDQLAPGVPVRAGQVISGKYRVEELLGCSATAIVVTARHVHLRHPVTLKILTAYTDEQLDLVKRQVRKARVASRLRGSHVARIVDIATTEDGMPYIATDRLDGHTLAMELEQRGGRLPIEEALQLGLEICEGLAEAHAVGLVHGDLKTKNLFVANGVLKILDFGMASPIESSNDASATAWFGMPSYLAPEQIKDPSSIDHRADIWSLGVILHELISGALPFSADTVSGVLVAVCCDAAPLLSEAPYELARVIHRCLEKDPNDRPASVEELANEIGRFLGEDGKRAAERVRVALAKRDFDDEVDADASHSIPPMSVPVESSRASHAPLPLVTRRHPWEQSTKPSQRVVADRRRSRARTIAIGTVVAATAIAAAAMVTSPPSMPRPGVSMATDDDVVIPSSREPFEVRAAVPASDEQHVVGSPHDLPSASSTEPPTASRSTSGSSALLSAAVPVPPVSTPRSVFVRPKGFVAPPPPAQATAPAQRSQRASRSGLRLPGWLPGGRDPSVIASNDKPAPKNHDDRGSKPSAAPPPSLPPAKTDDTYMRNLFTERK